LTTPAANEIEISLFGPGYGECLVVHLGGGDWIIVDSCLNESKLPVALAYLGELGVDCATAVKLVVSTHWHDDHIRGLSKVVRACEAARIVVSAAMREEQFLTLVDLLRGVAALTDSGINEWTEILETLSTRMATPGVKYLPPRIALSDMRVFQRVADLKTGVTACEIWSLSPSDEDAAHAREGFKFLAPKGDSTPEPLTPMGPNHTSIVLWLEFPDTKILLGADLEQVSSSHGGWSAVVGSTSRPTGLAQVFKVPHHGSQNGHSSDVWSKMLEPKPLSLVSPFVNGRVVLPTAVDVARITSLSKRSFVTAEPEAKRSRRKKSRNLADWTMLNQAKHVRSLPSGTGHIRLRKLPSSDWQVTTLGTARAL
jgi:beta-lactamase superfamily II metal-dependent hydrolase